MASNLPTREIDELSDLLQPILEQARAFAEESPAIPEDALPDMRALHEEAQALVFVLLALLKASPLEDTAAFVSLGKVIGTIMAQSSIPHADLFRLLRNELRMTYDFIVAIQDPAGSA